MDLTDEELKQHITATEVMLLGLRKERMAREAKLAETLVQELVVKAQQYFGPTARVKVLLDEYDLQACLVVEIPTDYDDEFIKNEDAFYGDREVLDKFCAKVFVHTSWV